MTQLGHERYCDEIVAQTDLLRQHLTGADLAVTVPTCPEWTLRELAEHVGRAHRWVEHIVRTRATEEVPESKAFGFEGPKDTDPGVLAALDAWLAEGATQVAGTLRAAGPDAGAWTWAWERTAGFWARRMTLETVIHRADVAIAARTRYEVAPDLAADAIDEWLQIVRFVQEAMPQDSDVQELRGSGRSIHLHATDADPGLNAEWLIELDDKGLDWRRGHEKATVALRGPLTEVLLGFYRRLPLDGGQLEIRGERELLEFWLERATFG
ncbi:maleylpyruvate isomerase family mycothiol-dependent enzyme [Streptomyces sporangiiformans]|uniref:Maleylpyruvate isomerase family mycothiol-dependent enzyme n=1 Tax=Streptomyces sporangiiformans TaxID=2315329 RepID=A0A505DJS8_9ACTN|nr:maleylpyruvate isomerase family mycothiol-dependent enzyme [Streptomyces sporangiiformans]TPQ19836.1 maleylpyruvate isomerase family mycothiol-dependent enzyme [Streptomyces sporangiiformans]